MLELFVVALVEQLSFPREGHSQALQQAVDEDVVVDADDLKSWRLQVHRLRHLLLSHCRHRSLRCPVPMQPYSHSFGMLTAQGCCKYSHAAIVVRLNAHRPELQTLRDSA